MYKNNGTIPKKKLPNIISLTLDHLKTTINYKDIPRDSIQCMKETEEFDPDKKM